MAKTALVISGGGSRSAFAVGALKYLYAQRPAIEFDIICGTGTSALIAPLAALGEIGLLEKLFTSNSTTDIVNTATLMQRFPHHNSLYNATALTLKVNNIFSDARFHALEQLDKEIFVTGYCLQTNRTTYFSPRGRNTVQKDYDIITLHDNYSFREAVLASISMPVFMPPVAIASLPDHVQQFTNGGGEYYNPIKLAIDKGATTIYTILLTPAEPEDDGIEFKSLLDVLEKQIDIHTNGMSPADLKMTQFFNDAITYLDAVKENMKQAGIPEPAVNNYFDLPANNPFRDKKVINLHIIRPKAALRVQLGGLEFIPEEMKMMMKNGEEAAAEILEKQKA
ncbi:patatin-like phospholipase [Chitinophaga polysaccharea]|uniref:Patatin-like phospholipase n=1 Tax=Chitinophaga polysaccharea TaxID=1293035 RepID=A0A561Q5G7_9BACT|nr:patatin-like phospholipase family protein [Chitinophaga polysaccharea]TWF45579.1 patatin-like phospholipase [Chitinophaga polysaccharea]